VGYFVHASKQISYEKYSQFSSSLNQPLKNNRETLHSQLSASPSIKPPNPHPSSESAINMPENTQQPPKLVGVTELFNTSPSKVQPWMQAAGGIPQAKTCSGLYDPAVDCTHTVLQGEWLVLENAPAGLAPKKTL